MTDETETKLIKDLLASLDLGSSVAEHDASLKKYFVETSTFRSLVEDKMDVIAGDKGTGKTALFRILKERYTSYDELRHVEVLAAFNPVGAPVFQRLVETEEMGEDQYIGVWKAYFLALAGNYYLGITDGVYQTAKMQALDQLLASVGLRAADDSPQTIFSQLVNRMKKLFRLKSVEARAAISLEGMPVLSAKAEFQEGAGAPQQPQTVVDLVRHDDALRLLNELLEEEGLTLWLVMDRLDEAFQSRPTLERPALRALLRTYLDMLEFPNIRLKLFVRKDLVARIIEGGFVNLTHINARRIDITWDEDDLWDLLYRRLSESEQFSEQAGLAGCDTDTMFSRVFPKQVDPGKRKPVTRTWIMRRIRDGNDVMPPRNLIDLVLKAQESQSRTEGREPRDYTLENPIITGDALKRGLEALSTERVQDTLLAEAGGDNAEMIELFRGGKAEYDSDSLRALLGNEGFERNVKLLRTLGFLEAVGSSFKVPALYRGGLNITQGKAVGANSDDEDDA